MTAKDIQEIAIIAKLDDNLYQWDLSDDMLVLVKEFILSQAQDIRMVGPMHWIEINRLNKTHELDKRKG